MGPLDPTRQDNSLGELLKMSASSPGAGQPRGKQDESFQQAFHLLLLTRSWEGAALLGSLLISLFLYSPSQICA